MKQTTYIIADNSKLNFWTGKRWSERRAQAKTFSDMEEARKYVNRTFQSQDVWCWIVNSVEGGTV